MVGGRIILTTNKQAMAYKISGLFGDDEYFYDEDDAENRAEEIRKKIHQKYCVDKVVPGPGDCLCTRPDLQRYLTEKECSLHYYARTVVEHKLEECEKSRDVIVDEIEIN